MFHIPSIPILGDFLDPAKTLLHSGFREGSKRVPFIKMNRSLTHCEPGFWQTPKRLLSQAWKNSYFTNPDVTLKWPFQGIYKIYHFMHWVSGWKSLTAITFATFLPRLDSSKNIQPPNLQVCLIRMEVEPTHLQNMRKSNWIMEPQSSGWK